MKTIDRAVDLSTDSSDRQNVLASATLRAAEGLGLSRRELARIVGTSEASLSRMANHDRGLDPESKQGELALLLIRVFRSLDALVGGSSKARVDWMRGENSHIEAVPADAVQNVSGLVRVVEYLDALRG